MSNVLKKGADERRRDILLKFINYAEGTRIYLRKWTRTIERYNEFWIFNVHAVPHSVPVTFLVEIVEMWVSGERAACQAHVFLIKISFQTNRYWIRYENYDEIEMCVAIMDATQWQRAYMQFHALNHQIIAHHEVWQRKKINVISGNENMLAAHQLCEWAKFDAAEVIAGLGRACLACA